jgi:DNA-binding transcriptional LysR family regulator
MADDPMGGMALFVRVAETGSMTRAAAELSLTKSTVSEAVRRLEERLGVRLLDRTTRRLTLTEAGQAYAARARRALEEAQGAVADARALQETPAGRLRVAIPEVFTRLILTPLLGELLDAWPDLQIELVEGQASVDLLAEQVDLAIRIAPSLGDNQIVRRLGTSEVVIVASPAYLARRGEPASPYDLAHHTLIGFSPLFWGHEWRLRDPEGRPVTVPVRPAVLTDSTESLLVAAAGGVGLTAVPSWTVAEELRSGALVQVLRPWRTDPRGIYAVYPSNRLMAAKVKLFVDLVARRLRALGLAD